MPGLKVKPPTLATLKNYGLSLREWLDIASRQGGLCPICNEPFGNRKLAIDHEHVRGWRARKHKKGKSGKRVRVRVMAPAERKLHVRGILHSFCNRMVRKWLTLEMALAIAKYLEAHNKRLEEQNARG